jgi:hypothetical protein
MTTSSLTAVVIEHVVLAWAMLVRPLGKLNASHIVNTS